jgi:hypothetical protein
MGTHCTHSTLGMADTHPRYLANNVHTSIDMFVCVREVEMGQVRIRIPTSPLSSFHPGRSRPSPTAPLLPGKPFSASDSVESGLAAYMDCLSRSLSCRSCPTHPRPRSHRFPRRCLSFWLFRYGSLRVPVKRGPVVDGNSVKFV